MKVFIGKYPKKINAERKISIRIDPWDTWSMDHTLALIILPMLKQLRASKHGSPGSIPFFNQTSNSGQLSFPFYAEGDSDAWEAGHQEWTNILDKMIWSFEQVLDDNWDEQYWIKKGEIDWEDFKTPIAEGEEFKELKWKSESVVDWKGREEHANRIQEGLELFGKYFQDLWD